MIFLAKTRDNPDGMHRVPGPCLYCGVHAADTIETDDGILLRCPKCKFSSGPHVTYGIAVRGWRWGLPSQALTILLWVADEADAMLKRSPEADPATLAEAIEAARWFIEIDDGTRIAE